MAFLAAFLLVNLVGAGGGINIACAKSNVQAFNACMARCHAISCQGGGSGSCKNKKLACFAGCQQLIKPVNGKKSGKYRR